MLAAVGSNSGVEKRMRKGTKSCYACKSSDQLEYAYYNELWRIKPACHVFFLMIWWRARLTYAEGRKRKTRCIYTADPATCTECGKRPGSVCTPQGLVADDREGVSYAKREKLTQRVARLESMIAPTATNAAIRQKMLHVRPGLDHDAVDEDDAGTSERAIESSTAPLMRLMQNPVLGAQDSTEPPSTDDALDDRLGSFCNKVVAELMAFLPAESELRGITSHKGAWWPLWRHTAGLVWGDVDCTTLDDFATRALQNRHPGLLGILLVSLSIASGDLQFLAPVERLVVHNDRLAGSEYGLGCITALALCYLNNLQPRRAWTFYRRGLTLLQLSNIHVTHRRSEKQDSLFWQLFHADRWVSMMIGLPYMLPDLFCDLEIASIENSTVDTWLHHQLIVVTGRVIDCVQDTKCPSFSKAIEIDERINDIQAQLPSKYLDLETIKQCDPGKETAVRVYRVIHLRQLKEYLHLPFFLRSSHDERYGYSRWACTLDARRLLAAYTYLYEVDSHAVTNGTLLNFNAFVAAIVLLLNLFGYGNARSNSENDSSDRQLVEQTQAALQTGIGGISSTLCKQCHQALKSLVDSTNDLDPMATRRIVLPYFGTITVTRGASYLSTTSSPAVAPNTEAVSQSHYSEPTTSSYEVMPMHLPWTAVQHEPHGGQLHLGVFDDISVAYQGPYFADITTPGSWVPKVQQSMHGSTTAFGADRAGAGDFGSMDPMDWSWLNADLPPQG